MIIPEHSRLSKPRVKKSIFFIRCRNGSAHVFAKFVSLKKKTHVVKKKDNNN